mgnify:FL=1
MMTRRTNFWILPLLLASMTNATATQAADSAEPVKVELIDAGKAPLQPIRYAPRVGETQSAVMTISIDMKMSIAGNAMPAQDIPAQKVTFDTTVENISEDGDITFSFIYTGAEVIDDPDNPSPMAPMLKEMIKSLVGATGSANVTDRGITKSADFNIPEGMAPQMKQMLDGMKESMNRISSPVPSEPIGLGAKWKVTQKLVANGMHMVQTSTHEIVKLGTGGFTMKIDVAQSAEPQEIKNPALPPGTILKLASLDTDGQGTSQIETRSLIPVQSSLTIASKSTMDVEMAGQKQQMTTDVKMGMELETLR